MQIDQSQTFKHMQNVVSLVTDAFEAHLVSIIIRMCHIYSHMNVV